MSTSTLERTKRAPSRAAATPVPLPCTGARLRRLTRRLPSFYEQNLRGLGLKLGQYSVLVHLGREPQTLMHLADELEMDRTTLTRGIQPLIEHGGVSEVPGSDARQRCFVLTAQGERFRQDAEANGARRSWRGRPGSGATSPPICRHSSTRPWIVSNPHSPRTTDMSDTQSRAVTHAFWPVVLLAASVLMITMGARQSLRLFVSPLNTATGLGIASISLAMAVGQFMWGAVQPIAGAVADRYGPGRVLAAGTIILALGYATTPYMTSSFGLMMTIGVLPAPGSGAGSFSVLIGAAGQSLP